MSVRTRASSVSFSDRRENRQIGSFVERRQLRRLRLLRLLASPVPAHRRGGRRARVRVNRRLVMAGFLALRGCRARARGHTRAAGRARGRLRGVAPARLQGRALPAASGGGARGGVVLGGALRFGALRCRFLAGVLRVGALVFRKNGLSRSSNRSCC